LQIGGGGPHKEFDHIVYPKDPSYVPTVPTDQAYASYQSGGFNKYVPVYQPYCPKDTLVVFLGTDFLYLDYEQDTWAMG